MSDVINIAEFGHKWQKLELEKIEKKDLKELAESINRLLSQLYSESKKISEQDLLELFRDEQQAVILLITLNNKNTFQDNPVIGMASIYFLKTFAGLKGIIEDVVVDKNYRGRGIGKDLILTLINVAKEKGASYIELTSNPSRSEANNLYQKLGFKKRETNVYRLELAP